MLTTNDKEEVRDSAPGRFVRLYKRPLICCDLCTFRGDPMSSVVLMAKGSSISCYEGRVMRTYSFEGIHTIVPNNGRHCLSMCRKLGTTTNASCILVRSKTHPVVSRARVQLSVHTMRRRRTYIVNMPMGSAVGIKGTGRCTISAPSEDYL